MKNYKVKEFKIEQTGGYVYVAWGSFTNETYFSIGSDGLMVYDEDEYIMLAKQDEDETFDLYTWEQAHLIDMYDFTTDTYKAVIKQIYDKLSNTEKLNLAWSCFNEIEE